jgi:Tol biopolymer transport system component/DNA-binding winged helix-turn-helix (wHTH) protein
MDTKTNDLYEFGPFRFHPADHALERDGEHVSLPPRVTETLSLLLQNAGHLVEKDTLIKEVWKDAIVEEGNLNKNIFILRKALGQRDGGREYIETVPKRGYRFVGAVTKLEQAEGVPQINAADGKESAGKRALPFVILGALALLIAALPLLNWRSPSADDPKVVSFVQLTHDGREKHGAFKTDGSRLYMTEFQSDRGTFLAQASVNGGETEPRPLALKAPRLLDLSKNGIDLLLLNGESDGPKPLWIQSVVGGAPQRVGDLVVDQARWGPDEDNITYSKEHDIFVVNRDGGSSRKLVTVPGVSSDLSFSPDGKRWRFTLADDDDHTTSLWEVSSDGTNLHPLLRGWNTPASECCGSWTSDGEYFVFESTQHGRTDLWAIREKNRFLATSRKPEPITSGPMNFFHAVSSKDGRELFAVGVVPRAEVVRYDLRTHHFIPFLSGVSAEGLDFSKDGNWVTYTSYPEGTLWRSKIDGSERLQLTFPPMRVFLPRWSPDGRQIAFMGSPPGGPWKLGGPWKIYLISPEGGAPQQLLPGDQDESDPTWSTDSKSIVFGRLAPLGNSSQNAMAMNVEVVDLKSRKISKLPGSDGLFSPRWSPDGRYIVAFKAKHPTKPQLFDWVTQKWTQIANSEMGYPSWSRDGKYISMQDWNGGRPRVVRLFLSDRRVEGVMNFTDVESNMVGTIVQWTGLALDGSPLVARDISVQEIYALKLRNQ